MQMKAIEYFIDRAEYVLQAARQRPPKRRHPSGPSKWKSLNHKLNDLFVDESEKEPENKKLRSSVHLLDKLVTKEKLTCLVVNLYPGNKGYSLMLKGKNGIDSETIKLPYEESDLLDYLDTEELPPILVDLLERSQANVFYNGCVIAEVRDFRRTANSKTYESHHVLLRPTAQTLVCDVNAITNDGEHRWTQDDKHELEKQLVLATAEPLCLDPSPVVAVVSNRIQHHRLKFSTKPLKRCAKRFSQTSANRRREMTTVPAPPHLFLHDFLQKRKEKRPHPPVDLKCVDMWKQRSLSLSAPSHVEVENYASVMERPKSTSDNTPITVEEVVLEAERSNNKILHSRVTIQQRPTDNFYQGELYVDRDHQPGDSKRENGTSCKFPLGSKVNAQRYIQQYKDLFTEEGRRSVKIAHIIPGQPPQITHTQTPNPNTPTQIVFPGGGQGLLAQTGSTISPGGATQYNRPLLKGSRSLGNKPKSFSGGSSGGSKSKRPPPIKLSLSLNNTGSLSSNLMSPPGEQGDAGTPTSSGLGASHPSPTISMGAPMMTPTMAMSRSLGRQIPVYPLPGHSVVSPTDGVGTPPLASSGAGFPHGTMKTPKTPPPLRPGSAPGAPSGQHSLPNILSRRQSVPEITQGGAQGQGSVSMTSSKVPTPSGTPTGTPTGTPKPGDAPPTPSSVPTPTSENLPINIIGTMAQAGGIVPTITTTTSGGLVSMRIPMCVTMVSGTPTAVVTTPSGVITTPINLSGAGPGIMTGAINIIGGTPIGGSITSSMQGTATSSQQVTAAPINITAAGMAAQGINPALAPQFLATGLKNAPQGLRPGTAPLSLLQVQGQQPQLIPFNPQALQGRPLNQATLQQLQAQGQLPQGVQTQQIQLNAQQLQQIQQFQAQALQQSQSSPQQGAASDQPQQNQQIQQSLLQQFQQQQLQQALLLQQQGIQGQMQQLPQGQQQLAPLGYQKPPSSLTVQQQLQQSIQQRQTSKSKSRKRTTPTPPKQS
ncbi:transcription factor SPT20 homolog isoform X4 [Branchiostoma floridae]|uniref:Transcription factor SPT20 homolog isoform X4 n=1 Tax=Branchiostoma floridae TaxID=7739 RepID=A0A9J7LEZ0_BRAFL|nr:transcription factor SPT20 homolog isoform X4 [Branchiostoma floridae]